MEFHIETGVNIAKWTFFGKKKENFPLLRNLRDKLAVGGLHLVRRSVALARKGGAHFSELRVLEASDLEIDAA